jgi:voltage-gated potassium channel
MAQPAPKKPLLLEGSVARQIAADPPRPAPVERITWIDYLFVGLAILSLCLVIAEEVIPSYWPAQVWTLRWLIIADAAICGVFAIEFFARMRHQPNKWAYTKSRWYDVIGMIPVSHPFFRGFRLLRILRIFVITSRFVRATNRSFGEMLVESTLRRFRDVVVDVIGGAIVIRGIGMVEPWLVRARFAERIGEALEERRGDIHRMVRDTMARLPGGRLATLPPLRGAIERAELAAVQTVIDVLKSEDLNRVVQQSTQNVLEELRHSIADSERQALTDRSASA